MRQNKLKKATKLLLKSFLLFSPFLLLFSLPLLSLDSSKTFKLPVKSNCKYILLYFGYPGCGTNCPDTLGKLSTSFQEHRPKSLELIFINIIKSQKESLTDSYVKVYDKSFRTQTLSSTQRLELMEHFNIQEEEMSMNIDHSNFLFLLKNEGDRTWTLTNAFPDVDSYIRYKNNGLIYEKTISKL